MTFQLNSGSIRRRRCRVTLAIVHKDLVGVAKGLVQSFIFPASQKRKHERMLKLPHNVCLILHASKIMLRIIINRMKVKLEEEISIRQAGFREERRTRDQIVNIRSVIEKCKEHRMPLYLCFIDYAKSFAV